MYEHLLKPCPFCGSNDHSSDRQWWHLNGYFGISGYFCPDCYDLVSHDSYRKPNNPEQYTAIMVKQQLEKSI